MSDPLAGLAPAWLRANCPCGQCRDARSGQRLVSITDVPADAGLAAVAAAGDEVAVTFSPDGHRAVFKRAWLAEHASLAADERTEDAKRLWTAADFPGGPPAWSWPEYLDRRQTRADCLAALLTGGFALLRGVPREPGAVLRSRPQLGFVRETNYGRLFDVRVTATPSNLAFTGLPIPPHTDNPYRDPVPTVQLLHCLDSDVAGGDSGVTDGFAAAGLLRAADPAAFGLLAAHPGDVRLRRRHRRAARDPAHDRAGPGGPDPGDPVQQPVAPALAAPAGTADPAASDSAAAGAAFYAAYRAFARIVLRRDLQLTFRLAPGDCLVLDNTRVLHARTGFAATGGRHLQGCYADLDGVSSALALLRRTADV